MATRKCRTCQAKLRVEDTHALCWEHIGRSYFCRKCEDLVPLGRYKDYQQFLANCWREKDEKEGVDDMPQLSPCRRHDTAEEGEIVEAARESSHSALRASQDGGVHAEGSVVTGGIVEEDVIGDFGSKSPQASVPLGSDKAVEGPPRDLAGVWKKVRALETGFEGLRSEVKNGLLAFKEEIVKLFSGKTTPDRMLTTMFRLSFLPPGRVWIVVVWWSLKGGCLE